MPAESPQPGHDEGPELSPNNLRTMALWIVLPIYGMIAALIEHFAGSDAVLSPEMRFPTFATLCGISIAAALFSYRVRIQIDSSTREISPETAVKALGYALALAETPAFCGLLYFILYREWVGFMILLLLSLFFFVTQRVLRTGR